MSPKRKYSASGRSKASGILSKLSIDATRTNLSEIASFGCEVSEFNVVQAMMKTFKNKRDAMIVRRQIYEVSMKMSNYQIGHVEHTRLNKMLREYVTNMCLQFGASIQAQPAAEHVSEHAMVEAASSSLTPYPDTDIDEDIYAGFDQMSATSDSDD